MAPYRPNGQSRRSGARGYVDHDFYEGLPVRHWRRTTVQVGVPPKPETPSRLLQPELPLPKEANLLSQMSRALLQAARAGTINKTPPAEEEVVAKEGEDEEDDEERGFVASRWSLVPRHLEGPEPEYLAKKRKGLELRATTSGAGAGAGGGMAKKAKVRRTDAEGNAYVEEVVITDGQKVEGEVIVELPTADATVPGVVAEGVGVVSSDGVAVTTESIQPTPPRRRPPPPRRKPKGPGRGRKRKVQFVPGAEGAEGTVVRGVAPTAADGSLIENGPSSGEKTLPRVGLEGAFGNDDGDTEMMDDSNLRDGDEEDDDNDECDEGDEGDDDDREEGELTPSPTPDDSTSCVNIDPPKPQEPPQPIVPNLVHPLPPRPDIQAPAADPVRRSASSSPDLPLAAGQKGDPLAKEADGGVPDSLSPGKGASASADDRTPASPRGRTVENEPTQDNPTQELLAHDSPAPEEPVQGSPVREGPAREDLPQENSPPQSLPQEDPLQEDPLQEDLLQEDLLQEDPLQEDPLQGDPLQEDLLHEALSRESLPLEVLPLEGLPREGLPREGLPHESLPHESLPHEELSHGNLPHEDLLQEELLRESLLQEDLLQEDLLQEGEPHGDLIQETLAQEDPAPLHQSIEPGETTEKATPPADIVAAPAKTTTDATVEAIEASEEAHLPDGEIDLFGSLEKHLAEHSSIHSAAENPPATVEGLPDDATITTDMNDALEGGEAE
ncbi:hypothetical protein GP486_006088 [Trichoglossum hirsutum]|uniref:Uncharacterized protein n=1 Tax=Trichoglossum hirsutum TaxID=265104 RepID=A0A9P8L800_9PEZI|nr:hypothetical protein GP486_006088 [Trichoglossum hirsutum]